MTAKKSAIAERLSQARERTLWLLDQVPEDFLRKRVHSFYSPIGWHFGHIARTEEYWICRATGAEVSDEALSFLFADLPENPKDNRVNLPETPQIKAYMARTRLAALEALEAACLEVEDPLLRDGYAWEFALQHECQHQETIGELLCLIQRELGPATPRDTAGPAWRPGVERGLVNVPGGTFCMGSDEAFVYDNERRPHPARVEAFQVERYPVTALRWSEFMADGGYNRRALWSEEGWAWKTREGATKPEYWHVQDGAFFTFCPTGLRPLHPDEPAASVSWHEAEAFCRWSGQRLPTEAEWEFVAASDPTDGESRLYPWGAAAPDDQRACSGLRHWGPQPVGQRPAGRSALGVEELAGQVWEWTASVFLPYPGFEAYPYPGYSKDHMGGGHRVCRGGSWASADPILRCSFRNWYVPTYRQGFLGLRCAV